MDVVNGYLARRRQGESAVPETNPSSGWMAAAEANGGTAADLQQTALDDTVRAEEKFGVYKETLFDYRDYGLD